MGRLDINFRHYGSARFLLRSVAAASLLVLAGAVAHLSVSHGGLLYGGVGLVTAMILVFSGVVVNAEMNLRVHQKNTPLGRITQLLLEEYWTRCVEELTKSGQWAPDTHLRFVVYIPLRYGFIGPSYLIPMHYLDRDERMNTDDFFFNVRTRSGWAGKVFATGKTMVADLERSAELISLYLTERQIRFLHEMGLKSKICVPLMQGPNRIVGVFSVESRDRLDSSKFRDPKVTAMIENLARAVFTVCDTSYSLRRHRVQNEGA